MSSHDTSDDPLGFLAGGGEMGARIRAVDWSATPLGPPSSWPQSLKTCVRIILTSRQPMFVWWGDQLINLYNDAYKAIVGGKHPVALGQPASVVWREIWDEVGTRAHSVILNDEGTYDEALLLVMERNGYPEETYYTFSYSPVPNGRGGIGGLICANTDDTRRIVGERQLALLRDLAERTSNARTCDDACRRSAEAIASAGRDLPFALIYLAEPGGDGLRLAATAGIKRDHPAAVERVSIDATSPWPFRDVMRTHAPVLVADAGARGALPTGAWDRPPTQVVAVPIAPSGETGRAGILVVGLNPLRPFDDAYQGFVGLVAGQIAASITNADAYEQEARRAEALAEIDRAKTLFFSNVSHEFRTPLTLMLGPLEDGMASSDRSLSPANLDIAYRNAVRLLKLVNTLLDFSRIEAGRANASFEPTDLASLTADLASAFRSAIERAGLAFQVVIPQRMEPIHVDHDMWEKIVLNLLSNALKFTFEGSIGVELREVAGRAELTVRDTGTGIPDDALPHLFERFHRVQGARSRTHEGSGIGLALVHELVRLHGGTIGATSTLGKGTAFTVSIPIGTAHLDRDRISAPRPLASTATGAAPYVQEAQRWLPGAYEESAPLATIAPAAPLAGANDGADAGARSRILLVDDNADMRDYVARILGERWTVEAVGDGVAALEAASRTRPDLVLTDVMMPNLDGFGLLRALKRDPETTSVPVIVLSARAGAESQVEGLEAGADDYLVKPFSARELVARVATHLQIARLRRAAERERAKLFDVFMQAPVPVAVFMGPELRYEVANPTYCDMLGRDALVGLTIREAFPEIGAHEVIALLEQVLATGEAVHVTELNVPVLRRGSAGDAFFNYVAQPLRDANGAVIGVIAVATEVTEQVVARRRVEGLRHAAEQASRAKDEFLSTLSHELRTPLNAIIGWSSLLRGGAVPLGQSAKALETIERNARAQARLIEDMLDLSRIEQGKLVLHVGPVEMVRIVDAAIDAVRPAAEAKSIRLQPVLDSQAMIVGDADRLQQVVWNLLSNAIKFTAKGGRVQIRLHREHSHVEIAVADDGQGIEPDLLPFVFDRFRQGDSSFTRKAGGLGLGLAIVRSLVELHGGTVTASSDGRGAGATFVVRLPTAPLRADGGRALDFESTAPEPSKLECPSELRGLRVLVVDDEHETRELLGFVIAQCDAHVTTLSSAAEVLAALQRETFDVLISDVGMPTVDGYALIRSVRALPPSQGGRIPALALTAYARAEDRMQALRAGFHMHLSKPIEPAELLVVLATLVHSYPHREPE